MLIDYRVRQREYLLEISRALTAQLNLDELLQMVLKSATSMLAGQAGLIALRSTDGSFTIRASYGLPRALAPYFEPLLAIPHSRPGRETGTDSGGPWAAPTTGSGTSDGH